MHPRYNLAYFVFALGLTLLMVSVDAQAKIAFVSARDGHSKEIDVMDADGGNPRKLIKNPGVDDSPSWSPDSKHIVLVSNRGNNNWWETDIHVMDANGRNPQNPTNNHAEANDMPSWAPDGGRIVFMSYRDGNAEIYVMDANGQNPQRLTNYPEDDWYPSWSPDGERIAFVSDRGRSFDIYVIDADGGNLQNLTNVRFGEDSAPAWFHSNLAIAPAAVAPTSKKISMWGWFKSVGR